ncbi:hypothetical protein [Paenibacillus sp. XY044]|uniref:hypothetical protein n=1 Tax=Paenibacillus sp. XY044 TaxID=2026089 RepID=UPI000B99D04A|nr:hypothetical protein [Paenibacillus sp. XY044]OZB96207.1 hypothetical protein CJP46_09880 [Paenibacillus sp. XY044]
MKSPGGSTYPYYYKGGEIHCLKYGSKYKNHDQLFALMRQEEAFIFQHSNKKLKIWVDFYKTSVTKSVIQELIHNMDRLNARIQKLSFVGLSGVNRWRVRRGLKKLKPDYMVSYFSDPEEAKTWLIREE